MVVILIVQGSNSGELDAVSPSFENSRSGIANNRGERLSSTTNTTSVSFFSSSSSSLQVDPENVLATTKEEEWITKKKVELTTKKQIETRVKRQVVLEDGKVVEDSGPIVTTNTTEDTEKQEHEQTEHRQIGDDKPEGWVAVPNSVGLIKEVKENKVKSREETEELLETEDVQHLGDITDDAYLKAIQSQRKDLRLALRQASSELLTPNQTNGRVVHHSLKNRKTVDKEDTKHLSEVQSDGRLITETTKTTEHEEVNNTAEPDDDNDREEDYERHEKSSQRFKKVKDQELVEYIADGVKIGEEIKFEAENVEGDRKGNPNSLKMDSLEWESLSERIRRMRREKQQKLEEAERMDALTKKPLNFDQEEETRKVETSKWLEHHFGSESRSSKSSLDGDNDDSPKKTKTSTSFINVTMKSTKSPRPQSPTTNPKTYYKGVSEWNGNTTLTNGHSQSQTVYKSHTDKSPTTPATKNVYEVQTGSIKKIASEDRSFSPFQPIKEKMQTHSSKFYTERASSPISNTVSELESSPLYASIQQKYNTDKTSSSYDVSSSSYVEKSNYLNGKNTPINGILRSSSPANQYKHYNGIIKTETNNRPERKSSLVKRNVLNKSWSRSERRLTDISDSDVQKEPDPDYTPRLRRKVPSTPDIRSSPPTDTMKKKIYQKTRFAADIPLVKRSPKPNSRPAERKSSIGETFRKIIGKFHTKETAEKKKKNRTDSPNSSISKNHNGYYQTFGNVDNHIADTMNDSQDVGEAEKSGRESPLPKQAAKSSYEESNNVVTKKRVTTPPSIRRSSLTNGSQTLDRNYRAKKKQDDMFKRRSPVQKYYMGEDPFSGSIYGKEKEYDGAKPFRRKQKNGNATDEEKKSVKSHILNGMNNILGGRLSKSTSKLSSDSNQKSKKVHIDYTNRGGIQTLPRKSKKQVYINDPSSDQENLHSRRSLNNNSSSMINVSVINNGRSSFKPSLDTLGPEKPARTYRTSLLRSKSFNVQLGPYGHETSTFKSNPQLHKLEESPAPLKSPSIVTSISRSTRDLSKSVDDDYFDNYSRTNGYSYDNSRRTFSKGLKSRAPELYKTLHEDDEYDSSSKNSRIISSTPIRNKHKILEYSNSFHSGTTPRKPTVSFESDRHSPSLNKTYTTVSRSPDKDTVNKTITRHGNNDDYSETVRITSKSNDPIRPSVTNTVQSFSKKTIPSRDGRLETIESSETTRVTKSHYRGDSENDKISRYNSKNGGVVIEVRNERR